MKPRPLAILAACLAVGLAAAAADGGGRAATALQPGNERSSFEMKDDAFLLGGKPFQIISGSIHYFRIHPAYWRDRLERSKAMGINTVEVYTPWNLHEPYPGQYVWEGWADVDRWFREIQDAGLKVLLRPGPYICAEWDYGGFPWWFSSSKVAGGGTMRMRSSDPAYLAHVDRWWAALFARLRPYLLENGGPILMVQMENEYGFCGEDKSYLRHLVNITRQHLSKEALLFTTDPPGVASKGTLAGGEVYTVVDFGPAWFDLDNAFRVQASLNEKGKSPPFCSEFYTGWLSHWGEPMANTSTEVLLADTQKLLVYANSTASLSFYMIHGGTNFGFWAGGALDGDRYLPIITSYDYDCPVSEAGDYCQPGVGGPCKYYALRGMIAAHTGAALPPVPPRPAIQAYGRVDLKDSLPLMGADLLGRLFPGGGVRAERPDAMEEYGQRWGLILYRTRLPPGALDQEAELDLGAPVHDYASVFVDGSMVGRLDRSQPGTSLTLPATKKSTGKGGDGEVVQLDILVEAMGRVNFGCGNGGWDYKGLTSKNVTLNGGPLEGWEVFPLSLDSVEDALLFGTAGGTSGSGTAEGTADGAVSRSLSGQGLAGGGAGQAGALAAARRLLQQRGPLVASGSGVGAGPTPTFFRGTFDIQAPSLRGPAGFLADSYLATHGWGKGIAWVNGFNLGWYWPSLGPQMTLYVPGPVLREGQNEVVLLELERPAREEAVVLTDQPDFWGPSGQPSVQGSVPAHARSRVPVGWGA